MEGHNEHQHDRKQKFLDLGGFLDCSSNGPSASIGGQIGCMASYRLSSQAPAGQESKDISTKLIAKNLHLSSQLVLRMILQGQGGKADAF